jgi:hypothetical protein
MPRTGSKEEGAVHPRHKDDEMHQTKILWRGVVAIAVVLVSVCMVHATGAGIQDTARFFSPEAVATAEQQIAAIQRTFGKDLRVETYATIPPDRVDQSTPAQRQTFFATWAYQRAKAVGLEVEVGDRTQHQAFTRAHRDQMRDLLVTAFKQRHFDDGLRQAVT